MLFTLGTWHAYAKLRLHTSSTLESLMVTTRALGQILRYFVKHLCLDYATKELPTDEAARGRCKVAAAAKRGKTANRGKHSKTAAVETSTEARTIDFNMLTYKLHALGDYVASIWRYGTTDNYSTQVVCSFICLLSVND